MSETGFLTAKRFDSKARGQPRSGATLGTGYRKTEYPEGVQQPRQDAAIARSNLFADCESKNIAAADLVRELKRESSKWIKEQDKKLAAFYWQSGYGAFSISPSHVEALKQYISDQEKHHRKESFQDEFRRLCKKYHVTLDERYCWD